VTNPSEWPKPFKVLNADIHSYSGNWNRMVDDFENVLAEWDAAGFASTRAGFTRTAVRSGP
jgi:hypothetical protein